MNGAGSVFSIFSIAVSAITLRLLAFGGTMSSSITGTPALAICAAMPLPITPAPITAHFAIAIISALQHRRDALAAADALRRQRVFALLALQQRRGLAGDARAGGAERMAQRDGAAVEIDLVLVEMRGRGCRRSPGWRTPR